MDDATRTLYQDLCEKFDKTYPLSKGGREFDYLTIEQVVSRLNEVLGPDNWEFRVLAHGADDGAVWVHGELTAHFPGRAVVKQQFGECQTSRGMAAGDARKGAASDCLKKAASLIGPGLYLSDKEEQAQATTHAAPTRATPPRDGNAGPAPAPAAASKPATAPPEGEFRLQRGVLIAFAGETEAERGDDFLKRCKDELGVDELGAQALLGEKVSTRKRRTGESLEQVYLVLKSKWDQAQGGVRPGLQRDLAAWLGANPGAGG